MARTIKRQSGENSPLWKGGRVLTADGYVRVPGTGTERYALEHRVVWEAAHGPIPAGMHIHHKNGDRADNRIENLELVTPFEHSQRHRIKRWARKFDFCQKCKTTDRPHEAHGLCVNCAQHTGTPMNKVKTHCPRGHAYTPENTRWSTVKKGQPRLARHCITCERERDRQRSCRKRNH